MALSLPSTARAARWFLESGIQDLSGGVARYYKVDESRNCPVSTEITGYSASFFAWLANSSGDPGFRSAALNTVRFLTDTAWDADLETFPFEQEPESPAYFFDCGIIVRGLLAGFRLTGNPQVLAIAAACGRSMARDFLTPAAIHPVVSLPDRRPWPYEKRWSREPGCFQLKAALAWRDLWAITGQAEFEDWWRQALEMALASEASFLPGESHPNQVMDRLHAYSYFLEALLSEPSHAPVLRDGLQKAAALLRECGTGFVRSDVYAQILRVRLLAASSGLLELDRSQAEQEAAAIPTFQYASDDPRLHGGFSFGRRGEELMPFANPVSTAFCVQAMEWWRRHESGGRAGCLDELI